MPMPSELQALSLLRRRGQCPSMTVFVTDCWKWADRLEDLGCLAIRLLSPKDWDHDWTAVAGLDVILLQRPFGDYADIGRALLAANPSRLETFTLKRGSVPVVGEPLRIDQRCRRDYLLAKQILAEAA